jgi:hypothetical protein
MRRFPQNDLISPLGEAPRYDLGDSHDTRAGHGVRVGDEARVFRLGFGLLTAALRQTSRACSRTVP